MACSVKNRVYDKKEEGCMDLKIINKNNFLSDRITLRQLNGEELEERGAL